MKIELDTYEIQTLRDLVYAEVARKTEAANDRLHSDFYRKILEDQRAQLCELAAMLDMAIN